LIVKYEIASILATNQFGVNMKISSFLKVYCLIGSICSLFRAQAASIFYESEEYFDQLRAAGLTFEGLRFGQEYFENNFAKLVLDGDPTGIIGGLAWDAEKFIISDGVDCKYWGESLTGWPSQPYYSGADAACYSERINHRGNSITVNRYYTRDDDLSPSGHKYFFGADIEFNNQKILYFTNFGRVGGTRKYIQDFIQEIRPELQNSALADNYGTSTSLFRGDDAIELPSTNDDVFVGGGNNSVDGGDGLDRIEFPNTFGKYVVNKLNNGAGYQVWDYAGQYTILRNVEIVRFLDGMELDETYQEFWGLFCPSTQNWPVWIGSSYYDNVNVCIRKNRNTGTTNNVWRFFNTRDNAFFYTSSRQEAFMVWANSLADNTSAGIPRTSEQMTSSLGEQATRYFEENDWPYVLQGTTFAAATYSPWDAVPLWRFYNYQTGHHFFTVSNEEKDFVIAKSESGEWPFNFEGEAFKVYTHKIPFSEVIIDNTRYDRVIPVYRLYSPSLNRHFFSANEVEIRLMKETGKWNDEGISFWAEEPCLSFPGEKNQFLLDGDCGR
jgi:hypothetical protein